MAQPTCADCQYWQQIQPDSITGECRQKSPVLVAGMAQDHKGLSRIWPLTGSDDWCGDFLLREHSMDE